MTPASDPCSSRGRGKSPKLHLDLALRDRQPKKDALPLATAVVGGGRDKSDDFFN